MNQKIIKGCSVTMRLIDADALIDRLREVAGCDTCDNYSGLRCRACPWDVALTEVYDWADNHPIEDEGGK